MKTPDSYRTGTLHALEQYSFSDEAAQLIRQSAPDMQIAYHDDIEQVWSVLGEPGHFGLIPVENSAAGQVLPHISRLLKMPASIQAEVRQHVRMCAGAVAGIGLDDVTAVCTHPKATEQSAQFLSSLPRLQERIAASSTVAGARSAAASQEKAVLALGSKAAIEAAGLQVLAEDVADLKGEENVTQMFVVKKNGERRDPSPEALYHAAYLIPPNERGILHQITGVISDARVDLRSLHSRSIGVKRYGFYLEMGREGSAEEFSRMVSLLQEKSQQQILWLGSWDDLYETPEPA